MGKTGLKVGRLGLGASYGAPAEAYEEAFEKGCNYFYWTTRKAGMRDAIKNICIQGNRDRLVIAIQSYSRSAALMEITTRRALRSLGIVSYTATRWGHLSKPNKMPPGETVLSAADCYRFALSNPSVDVCLCGPADTDQMREGSRCLELGPITVDELVRRRKSVISCIVIQRSVSFDTAFGL